MARQPRQRGYASYNGANPDGWEQRWRDQKDGQVADLQDAVNEAAQTMVEIREWIKNHDARHADDRQQRQQVPSDIRGWIATGISIVTLLLMLYLQNH